MSPPEAIAAERPHGGRTEKSWLDRLRQLVSGLTTSKNSPIVKASDLPRSDAVEMSSHGSGSTLIEREDAVPELVAKEGKPMRWKRRSPEGQHEKLLPNNWEELSEDDRLRHAALVYLPPRLEVARKKQREAGAVGRTPFTANPYLSAEDQQIEKVVINAAMRKLGIRSRGQDR